MKIIGHGAGHTIFVEMSSDEVACAAGYRSAYSMPNGSTDNQHRPKVGLVVHVARTLRYLHDMRDHQDKLRNSAMAMRGFAECVMSQIPETVIPPSPEAAEPQS